MDILLPPLDQQAAPPPWLVRREHIDWAALVRPILARQPEASVADIVRELQHRHLPADTAPIAGCVAALRAAGAVEQALQTPPAQEAHKWPCTN